MLAYNCGNCKKIILWGVVNEYGQRFCDENCYKKYCEKNNCKPNFSKLYKIKTIFNQ